MKVIALVSDLVFESRIRGVAAALGLDVACAREGAQIRADLSAATLAIVDLERPEAFAVVAAAAEQGVRVVGYYPHVNADLKQRALAAGASAALARSAFVEQLPDLLREAAESPGA